jgi:hypothetical protein
MTTTAESSRRAVARRPASPSGHSRHFQTVRRMSAYEPNSGRIADTPRPPLGANSGLMRCSKVVAYSLTLSARGRGIGSVSRPSAFAVLR